LIARLRQTIRPPGGQWVQAALGAPGEIAAQVRFGVLSGGALEPGQITGHGQPQLVRQPHNMIGRDSGQFREVRHEPTLRLLGIITKITRVRTPAA
jgi:hypothetical protein